MHHRLPVSQIWRQAMVALWGKLVATVCHVELCNELFLCLIPFIHLYYMHALHVFGFAVQAEICCARTGMLAA
jgi:hypothetical protein